jgi:hypothetical protein
MQEILDSSEPNTTEPPKAIDSFFKAYVIFHSVLLIISFLLSLFKAPEDGFIGMIFRVLTFSVLGFHLLYFILLIVKKKGPGRIIINLFNSLSVLVVAVGFIFHFAGWPFSMEMLTTGFVSVPFIMLLQLLYELSVRKDPSKFFSIVSSLGISTFAFGVLFVLQKWPYGTNMLIVGSLVTFAMMVIHFLLSIKKEAKYQIHIRYFAQCLFSLISALLILVSQ